MQLNLGSARNIGPARATGGGCSIGGIFFGLLLVPLGFYLIYHGEIKLINHGKVFERVQMMTADQAKAADQAQVKFRGTPEGAWLKVDYYDKPVVYFNRSVEQYEQDEDSDGNVTYDWESVSSESASQWASFSVDDIKVSAANAKAVGAKEVFVGIKPKNSWRDKYDPAIVASHDPQVGDKRLTLSVIEPGKELIVFGDMASGSVSSGTTFVVSALDDGATTQQLKTEYQIFYWLIKAGAVFAIGMGIISIFGPLLTLVGYIPFIGTRMTGAFGVLAFGFAIVSVVVVTLIIKLFWVIVVLAVVGIAVGVWVAVKSPKTPPSAAPALQAATPSQPSQPPAIPQPTQVPASSAMPQPVAPAAPTPADPQPGFCSNCGGEVEPDDKHCAKCGHKLRD